MSPPGSSAPRARHEVRDLEQASAAAATQRARGFGPQVRRYRADQQRGQGTGGE